MCKINRLLKIRLPEEIGMLTVRLNVKQQKKTLDLNRERTAIRGLCYNIWESFNYHLRQNVSHVKFAFN